MKAICIYLDDESFIGVIKVGNESTPEEAIVKFVGESQKGYDDELTAEAEAANYSHFFIDPAVVDKLDIKGDYSGIDSESRGRSEQMLKVCRAFEIKQVTVEEALRSLKCAPIDEALDMGWEPPNTEKGLDDYLDWLGDGQLAEMYTEELWEGVDDVQATVGFAEYYYVTRAEDFLKGKQKEKEDQEIEDIVDEYFE